MTNNMGFFLIIIQQNGLVVSVSLILISYRIRLSLGHRVCYNSNISSDNHAEHINKLSAQTAKLLFYSWAVKQ
jgi:hypothetical protein